MATPLAGKRVLIVEDNWIEKIALEQMIADAGATLIDRLDNSCDLGLLDIWSGNRDAVLPLARALIALRAPFLFYTSSMATEVERLQRAFPGCPIIEKPAPMQEILTELCKALDWKPAAVSEQQSPTRRSPERL